MKQKQKLFHLENKNEKSKVFFHLEKELTKRVKKWHNNRIIKVKEE